MKLREEEFVKALDRMKRKKPKYGDNSHDDYPGNYINNNEDLRENSIRHPNSSGKSIKQKSREDFIDYGEDDIRETSIKNLKERPNKKKTNYFFIISIIVIILIIVGLFFYFKFPQNDYSNLPKCSDGTIYDSCSKTKPTYCSNGTLVEAAYNCGCPEGYIRDFQSCKQIGNITNVKTTTNNYFIDSSIFKGFLDELKSWLKSINSDYINLVNMQSTETKVDPSDDSQDSSSSWFDSNKRDVSAIEQQILVLVNEERQRNGARALTSQSNLDSYARAWSDKMISQDFFEHSELNIPFPSTAGENIGETPIHYNVVGYGSTYSNNDMANCFVSGWIGSPGHHENMISKSFSMTGIGVACDSSKCRATEVFSG